MDLLFGSAHGSGIDGFLYLGPRSASNNGPNITVYIYINVCVSMSVYLDICIPIHISLSMNPWLPRARRLGHRAAISWS